jgi:hypothetical protein
MARKAGQLISRGSRTWLIRVSLGRDPETGARKYHNKTVRGSLREAQAYLNARLQERDSGRLPRAAAIRLDQFLDQWLATAAKPRLRPRSYTDYEALLRLHIRPSLGVKPLGAIGQFDIQSVYAHMFERGLSPRTIEYTNAVLQSAFRQAVRWKMLPDDPCAGVDLPPVKRPEMQALSVDECRQFLESARGSEWFALFALALTTGMRPSEYLALKRSDIDWQRHRERLPHDSGARFGLAILRYEAQAESADCQASGFRVEGPGRNSAFPATCERLRLPGGSRSALPIPQRRALEATSYQGRVSKGSRSRWFETNSVVRSRINSGMPAFRSPLSATPTCCRAYRTRPSPEWSEC